MGWKGTIRSVNAAIKAAERDARRRQRALEKHESEVRKMEAVERAQFEVARHENHIEVIQSLHKEISGGSWKVLGEVSVPVEPEYDPSNERRVQKQIDNYSPRFFDKLFGTVEKKKRNLNSKLRKAIEADKAAYEKHLLAYEEDMEEYTYVSACFEGLKNGDRMAYKNWITTIQPFEEIEGLGRSILIDFEPQTIVAKIGGSSIDVVPERSKSLLKTGKLSEKKFSTTKRNELYQDHLASCSLRVARELFEALPIEKLIVNTECELLNTATGYMEDAVILSVLYVRDTLERLNYDLIDPSDSLTNFVHNMAFKKSKGFEAVEVVSI